ncbi:probable serine/threonine-protein kinase nek3 [Anastrepha ludens]|uniref:probable serine/threonine-protein kinase nek3 n=1 Tax=Anastrepha ludens TaxID=28586 RepID=UPI0023B1BD4B|nr:probable serine/threonine-protein kinase nek3 [Anastrepha ludens]XP_053950222.1 probable serine/threonine-protein kinase nek3 [Anastrepha ludens]XP_053950223.1 probable serine/threonine-protein kinase nek3 [Anastrepha ludens]
MSDLCMDMHQQRTAATLANANENNIKFTNNINNCGYDIYSNNKNSFSSCRTPETLYSTQSPTTTGDMPAFDTSGTVDVDINNELANVLSLQLRKPKHWRWELSTSRSSANIALPRILLYDHKGQLLVDADSQSEQCYSGPKVESSRKVTRRKSTQLMTDDVQPRTRKRASKAATSNLAHTIKQALDRQFSGLQIQEATPSPVPSNNCSTATTTTPTTERSTALSSAIDFYTNELPDYKLQRRANSLKGVRFKVNDELEINNDIATMKDTHNSFNLANLPTPPSTITTSTTNTPTHSSSSGPREKRRYRRSHSSGRSPATSESILERFSFNKGRFSSPEYAEEHEVYHAPRYFLRTSKAGTLIVQEESFSRYRRRRRPRNSSTENIQSSKSSLKSDSGMKRQQKALTVNGVAEERPGGSLCNVSEQQAQGVRRKVYPVRRYLSDGNMLLQQQCSSSDEEHEQEREREHDHASAQLRPRKIANHRKQSKRELIMIDSENGVRPGAVTPESR